MTFTQFLGKPRHGNGNGTDLVIKGFAHRMRHSLERAFPEQRMFLRTDTETRFIRLSPVTQFVGLTGSALLVGWTIISSAILLMQNLGADNLRDHALREQATYEGRLNTLAAQRDARAEEAAQAQARFSVALSEVSAMQSRLLQSEDRAKELASGVDVIQATLRDVMQERDAERERNQTLVARIAETEAASPEVTRMSDLETTLEFLSAALGDIAVERDEIQMYANRAEGALDRVALETRLGEERNERIFSQIEDAVETSLKPIDKMFSATGLPTDSILEQVRRNYSGQGGPLTPIRFTTSGDPETDPTTERANDVLGQLDELNLYRIAAENIPFGFPVRGSYRTTSGFGPRWGRMHEGLDLAGPRGTPILAPGAGTVVQAGRLGSYGLFIKIRHDFGFETRYAHLSKIRVEVGQRVSLGERIGDMGNTGRSTGTHLHYEVRADGKAIDPMKYIKAARDVF